MSNAHSLWGFPLVEMNESDFIAHCASNLTLVRPQQNNHQCIVASKVCTYAAKEDSILDIFQIMRREITSEIATMVSKFVFDGRNYNFVWSWSQSNNDVYALHILFCGGMAWLNSWRDCAVGELTNDPDLMNRDPLASDIFIDEENGCEGKGFCKVECDGGGVGFIRLH